MFISSFERRLNNKIINHTFNSSGAVRAFRHLIFHDPFVPYLVGGRFWPRFYRMRARVQWWRPTPQISTNNLQQCVTSSPHAPPKESNQVQIIFILPSDYNRSEDIFPENHEIICKRSPFRSLSSTETRNYLNSIKFRQNIFIKKFLLNSPSFSPSSPLGLTLNWLFSRPVSYQRFHVFVCKSIAKYFSALSLSRFK